MCNALHSLSQVLTLGRRLQPVGGRRNHACLGVRYYLGMPSYDRAEWFAQRIERELRNLEVWRFEPLPEAAYESNQAFLADTMTFYQWLQFVLLPRIREVIAEKGEFPSRSQVGVYAVRELDGLTEASELVSLLAEFDDFIEGREQPHETDRQVEPDSVFEDTRPGPPPDPPEPPLAIAERYWRTRDPVLVHTQPRSRPGYDVRLAERVLSSTTALVELVGEPAAIPEGLTVRTVVIADRGTWLVITALRLEDGQWRVDLNLTLGHTAMMFLQQHQVNAPYTETDEARGRAMQFWQHVANRNERRARELLTQADAEIPTFGTGQIDEFFWYLDHTESNGTAAVRVLMNTHLGCRTLITRMVERGGAWFVDLAATVSTGL